MERLTRVELAFRFPCIAARWRERDQHWCGLQTHSVPNGTVSGPFRRWRVVTGKHEGLATDSTQWWRGLGGRRGITNKPRLDVDSLCLFPVEKLQFDDSHRISLLFTAPAETCLRVPFSAASPPPTISNDSPELTHE